MQRERVTHLFRIAGIPALYENKGLRDYEVRTESQQKALRLSKSYLENFAANPSRSMIVAGKAGTGKTHLCIGIIKNLMNRGLHCKYTTMDDMFASIKETYGNASNKTEEEVIQVYLAPSLLVLDEVGMSQLTKTENSLLYRIINGRYVDNKATLITTNLIIGELVNVLGDRVMDRLREGGGWLLDMQHTSYRSAA